MRSGPDRLFAGRGISGPGLIATVIVVLVAFGIGIAAGWGTTLFADRLVSPTPTTTPTASPSATPEPTVDVSVPPLEPITREIDDADRGAGLRTLDFPVRGDGTLRIVPVSGAASDAPSGEVVKYVRIEVEDGLQMTDGTLATFVMTALNDDRGWGHGGATEFVQTEGAPDVRVIFASPYTTVALCPNPHQAAALAPTSSQSPSASPSPSASAPAVQCASQGTVPISIYDWIAGLEPFGDDRDGARVYLLNHGLGHVLGKADVECKSGLANVMVLQDSLPKKCDPNPWPYPDTE